MIQGCSICKILLHSGTVLIKQYLENTAEQTPLIQLKVGLLLAYWPATDLNNRVLIGHVHGAAVFKC